MVLVYYTKIGGEDIKYHVNKAINNILHANIDVHSKRLILELPGYGVRIISKLQYHCANMTFYEKSNYDRLFQHVMHKGG